MPTDDVLAETFLGALAPRTQASLMRGARIRTFDAGQMLYRDGMAPSVGVLREGLLRIFLVGPDGRELTIGYSRRGDVLGLPLIFGPSRPVNVQALTTGSFLALELAALRKLFDEDLAFARQLALSLSGRLEEVTEEIIGHVFADVKQRAARHLLDLAAGEPEDGKLIARISHQELANAIGSVREVASRALASLRTEGLIRTVPKGVEVIDAARLYDAGHPRRRRG